MLNYKININKVISLVVLCAQMSVLLSFTTYAAGTSVQSNEIQNSLESVGTKANRLKTIGNSGVDESTGAFTYSYPINIPKGLLGLEPSINLTYNSQNSENSIIGYGWNMAIPYIERTAKYGVNRIYTNNDFVSSLGGELILKSGTTNQYIQKIDDGTFQLYTLSTNTFTMQDRSGNTYTYGSTLDSRLSDGNLVQKYYITEVKDILGNKVKYYYEKKSNYVYPKEIVYTVRKDGTYNNKITFEREARTDTEVSYKSGFRVELLDRVKTIHIYNNNNNEVAKIDLKYVAGQNGVRSLLSTISESRVGTDGVWSSIPDTKFSYEKGDDYNNVINFKTLPSNTALVDYTGDAKIDNLNIDNSDNRFLLIDINGDYNIDMYRNGYTLYYSGYKQDANATVRINKDGNFVDTSVANYKLPETARTPYQTAWWKEMTATTLDINGDGLTDVYQGGNIYSNIGNAFVMSTTTTPSVDLKDINADFNGDGLPDLIKNYSSSTNPSLNGRYVYLNYGNGWNSYPELGMKIPVEDTVVVYSFSKPLNLDNGVRYIDINSDGLVDVVRAYRSTQFYATDGQTYFAPTGSFVEVYINTGKTFVKSTNTTLPGYFVDYGYTYSGYNSYYKTDNYTLDDSQINIKRDTLTGVKSPLGMESKITYTGSVNMNNPKLPINIITATEVKTIETNKNLINTTKYTYENGKMYYDKNNIYDRRFAGFANVTIQNADKKILKYFHLGDNDDASSLEKGDSLYNIGKSYREITYLKGVKYSDVYRIYGVYTWDGQIYKYLKSEVTSVYDKDNNVFSKAVAYDYDLASRLPKKMEDYGEVSWNASTGDFQDVGEDYVLSKNIYSNKRPQKLLSEEKYDINGKFIDKKIYFYDELPFGYIEKGLLSEDRNYSNDNNYIKNVYTYNAYGLISSITDNAGAVTKYEYDTNYNPVKITNALNQSTTATYDKVSGLKTSETDASGRVVSTVYDGFGNVKSLSATSPRDSQVKILSSNSLNYNASGISETNIIYKDGQAYITTYNTYDSEGKLIKKVTTDTAGSAKTSDINYNNLGQIEYVTYPYDSNGVLGSYDAKNNTYYTYDELGRLISTKQGDYISYISYGINSKTVSDNTTDIHKKKYIYNSKGNLSQVSEYNKDGSVNDTKYNWDIRGNLIKLTDSMGNIRNFSYDSESRLTRQEDLHSPSDTKFAVYNYTYNNDGDLISKTDPSGNITSYEYDALKRPVKETLDLVTTYTYDNCMNGISKLCKVSNANYNESYEYNKSGNKTKEIKLIDGISYTTTYEYNDIGEQTRLVLPDNSEIKYTYDKNGKQKTATLINNMNGVASTTNIVTDASYNIDGTISNMVQGNNINTCYKYSGVNGGQVLPRLSAIQVGLNNCSSNLLYSQDLKYNLAGSIIENKEIIGINNLSGATSTEIINKYDYDALMRVIKSERLANGSSTINNVTYNPIGNIISIDTTNYAYDGNDYKNPHAPSLIGNKTLSYDLNGNVTNDGINSYEWNKSNTLKKSVNGKSIIDYTYDASGEKIKEVYKVKTNNATNTYNVNGIISTSSQNAVNQSVINELPYISEESYNELRNAKLNSENKIIALIKLAIESNKYVSDICKNSVDTDCKKKESIRFVASYLYIKHNIKLSALTLEEMYKIYEGKLRVSKNSDVYQRAWKQKTFDKTLTNLCGNSPCVVYTTTYKSSELFSTSTKRYLVLEMDPNYSYNNSDVVFENNYDGFGYPFSVSTSSAIIDNNMIYYDMSNAEIRMKTTLTNNYPPDLRFTLDLTYNIRLKLNNNVKINNAKFISGELDYKNIINTIKTTAVLDSALNQQVYGPFTTQDKVLLGYVYKQKKIASLFGSDKLISKESFAEINALPLTYSDLIIRDMLIDTSFMPYGECIPITDQENNRKCRKEIFIKYLYAIIRYETDKDLSPATLDELFEVTEGNLSIPNNIDEYKLRDTKTYIEGVNNYNSNILLFQYGNSFHDYTSGTGSSCEIGFWAYTQYYYYTCDLKLNIRNEAVDRVNEIEKVTIGVQPVQGRILRVENWGEYTSPDITAIPVISNNSVWNVLSNNFDTNNLYIWNADPNYTSPAQKTLPSEIANVDITSMYKAWAKGLINNSGIRFYTPGYSTNITNLNALPVTITYAVDAPQNDRTYFTPLVVNPKDTDVYIDVLRVLARIDKDYNTGAKTIVSAETYEEVKGTYATSTENVIRLVDENEKLQKDDTLSSVWTKIKIDTGKSLTREALEELYMVYNNKLSMPIDNDQYMWKKSTTTQVLASLGTTTIKSYVKIVSIATSTLNGVNYLNVQVDPDFTVYDRSILTNLSEVPGVFSLRSLSDADIISSKMYISTSSRMDLKKIGIESRNDIFKYTTKINGFNSSSTITRVNKINNLTSINNEIVRLTGLRPSRELLEEIYYIINNKLVIYNSMQQLAPTEISGLVSKYKLNGAQSSVDKMRDEQRSDKPIYVESGVRSGPGRDDTTSNGAYEFSSGYIKAPNTVPVITNNPYTYSIWYKGNGGQALFSYNARGSRNFFVVWFVNGKLQPELAWDGGYVYTSGQKVVTDNNWHKIDITLENSPNALIKMYVDGELDSISSVNGGSTASPYKLNNISNELIIGAAQNWYSLAMQAPMNGSVDEFKIYNKSLTPAEIKTAYNNDISNYAVVLENLELFDRTKFKLLEPIDGVISEYEQAATNNIIYSDNPSDYTLVSSDTLGEMMLAGIPDRAEIIRVFGLTATIDKDSKLSFFKSYYEAQKNYSFSRNALEEIYLIYLGKAIFLPANSPKILKSDNVFNSSNSKIFTKDKNGVIEYDKCDTFLLIYQFPVYNSGSCYIEFNYKPTYGYKTASLSLTGLSTLANYKYAILVNGSEVNKNEIAAGSLNLIKYMDPNKESTIKIDILQKAEIGGGYSNNDAFYISLSTNINRVDEMILVKNDVDNYGELGNVSTSQILNNSYNNEISASGFNLSITSTSTIWKTTNIAMAEFASSSINTVADIKNLFNSASSTLSKNAKLYFVWKKVKEMTGKELTRLTLEEMWMINIDKQLMQGGTPPSVIQTTTYPTSLASNMYYKFNGIAGGADKKKDEVRANTSVTLESNVTSATGKTEDTNGAYQLNNGYINVPNINPAITNNSQTMSMWVKGISGQALLSYTAVGSRNFVAIWMSGGKLQPEIGWNGGYAYTYGNKLINDNRWHKIDIVLENNPSANIRLYIDGELDSDSRAAGGVSGGAYNFANISGNITLGAIQNWSTGAYQSPANGYIDEFKLYNKALTADELRREYQIDTNTIAPIITQTVINSSSTMDAFNRIRYKELELITPISILENAYKQDTGALNLPPIISMTVEDPNSISPALTVNNTNTNTSTSSTSTLPQMDAATLALLNPRNYAYSILSPTSLQIQINGVMYTVDLANYVSFYANLDANNIDNLAKYLSSLEKNVQEISYTKYYINKYYEVDSRGVSVINVYFNNKVVATYKKSTSTSTPSGASNNLYELTYIHSNYQGTPILTTNPLASTTEVLYTNAWGDRINDLYSINNTIPTSHGYTGHIYNNNTNLIYAHARYLNTNNKTWLSTDPVQYDSFNKDFFLMNPQSQNSYAYANQDPINNIDPDGRCIEDLCIAEAVIVEGAISGAIGSIATQGVIDLYNGQLSSFETYRNEALTGAALGVFTLGTASWSKGAIKIADQVGKPVALELKQVATEAATKVTKKIHANSLDYKGTNYLYELIDRNTKELMKYGESVKPLKRYTQKWLNENNYSVKVILDGSKKEIHDLQNKLIKQYEKVNGKKPPLNKNYY